MKTKKKYLVIGISIPLICSLIVIYLFFIKTETVVFTWMPVVDGEETIDVYKQMGRCTSGYVSEDSSYASIEVTAWQRRKWLKSLYEDVTYYLERANDINHMRFEVSSDTKKMTVYADREVNFQTLATYLGLISWDIEMIQVLNGEADWGFEFTVKDLETEKILYKASCPEERVKVYEYFWDEIEE